MSSLSLADGCCQFVVNDEVRPGDLAFCGRILVRPSEGHRQAAWQPCGR